MGVSDLNKFYGTDVKVPMVWEKYARKKVDQNL